MMDTEYSFAYLDEAGKKKVRRALLKAVAIPGHQVPFASREMPLPYGWGTGGIQITASVIGPLDVLKVIDQGADDTTNAVSIRRFFTRMAGVRTTTRTQDATLIQTRHRIPEMPLRAGQVLVYQVPMPEPMFRLEPRVTETTLLHAFADYSLMYLQLYDQVTRYGRIAIGYNYPVLVHGRYLAASSPVPARDVPKMDRNPALQLFGAGREKRVYAIPPYTRVEPLEFEDCGFLPLAPRQPCMLCGDVTSWKDEIILDDSGRRSHVCSDSDFCAQKR